MFKIKFLSQKLNTYYVLWQVVEAELPWFVVIGLLLLLVIGLTLFVTFSMLDGVCFLLSYCKQLLFYCTCTCSGSAYKGSEWKKSKHQQ